MKSCFVSASCIKMCTIYLNILFFIRGIALTQFSYKVAILKFQYPLELNENLMPSEVTVSYKL